MLWVIGPVGRDTLCAVGVFCDSNRNKVIEIEGYRPVGHGLVPVSLYQNRDMLEVVRKRTHGNLGGRDPDPEVSGRS